MSRIRNNRGMVPYTKTAAQTVSGRKNTALIVLRESYGMGQEEFARFVGIHPVVYNKYENADRYPGEAHRMLLAMMGPRSEAELFPVELAACAKNRASIWFAHIPKESAPYARACGALHEEPTDDAEDAADDLHLVREAVDLLLTQAPICISVVAKYLGLDGGPTWTFREIGNEHQLSQERIRQIYEQTMLRIRMQCPGIAERLNENRNTQPQGHRQ